MRKTTIFATLALVVIFGGVGYLAYRAEQSEPTTTVLNATMYTCNDNKIIGAKFMDTVYKIPPKVATGEMPTPTGSVDITLSDGRSMNLKQTISGSGVRYANPDESFIFWVKGSGALISEDNEEKIFTGCVEKKAASKQNSTAKKLHDTSWYSAILPDFTTSKEAKRPQAFFVNEAYVYNLTGTTTIPGTRYTIPEQLALGTNLSQDSYISIEKIKNQKQCKASLFLDHGGNLVNTEETYNKVRYSVSSSTDAAAGNRYEEILFARPHENTCVAVRYFIHTTVLENYPQGSIRAFDRTLLIKTFDDIRDSVMLK